MITAAIVSHVAARVGSPEINHANTAAQTGTVASPNNTTATGATAIARQNNSELKN
ncbi:MAG: hypothetical protein R8G60_15140 [Roseovarius pacificus]|nr:hypothetical protein [Roseovarius pacificus]